MVDNTSSNPNLLSKESYFESFETFLQNLAPVKLAHDMENSGDPFQSTMIPKAAAQGISLDLSCRGGGGDNEDAPKDEVKQLQELVELLQVRLDALQRALEIQEQEVCKGMGETGTSLENSYEKLLTRWRREVCVMLLKQRVDALQFEQRQLQHTKKEHHLSVQLHEARALVEVLKQKERNSQAEIAILTTSTKMAEMTMREEGARRQHEMQRTLKGASKATMEAIAQIIKSYIDGMSLQMERVTDALCRLDMHVRRLYFAEQQVAMAAGLISSNVKPQGASSFQKRSDVDPRMSSGWKECVMVDQQKTMDHIGRANQLEVLLAAAKTQLVEECLHAKELQGRLVKTEVESKEFTKRATKKLQEQADRDLAAIKRQHGQALLSLQQKVVKLQADQARGIVAQHQLERKMLQQQQEFTQTFNQKDVEFKKSLEAKEIEVSNLLNEQNTLLLKLKKFWRPILNSSSAKVFHDQKNAKGVLHPQENVMMPEKLAEKVKTPKSLKEKRGHLSISVETQTEEIIGGENKFHNATSSPNDSRYEEDEFPQDEEIFPKMREKGSSFSRVSTPSRKNRPGSRLSKKNDDDLIASFLTKLQKAYVKSKEISSDPFVATPPVDTSLPKFSPTTPYNEGDASMQGRHTPRSSVGSKESFEINDPRAENLAQYVICVPRREARNTSGNTFFLKTRRKKKVVSLNHSLRAKLENLEDLGESLLSRGHLS